MATLALTLLTYAHAAVSQVVHVELPHLALAHLPSCPVLMLGEVINLKQPVQRCLRLRNGNWLRQQLHHRQTAYTTYTTGYWAGQFAR